MFRFGFPAVCALVVLSTARAAANGGPPPEASLPPPSAPQTWTGFYGGVQGGWLGGRNKFVAFETDHLVPTRIQLSDRASGFATGGLVGLNEQYDTWIYGGEIDLEFADLSTEVTTPAGNRLSQNLNVLSSIRARFGYDFDPVLPYVTAGLALGNVNLEAFEPGMPSTRLSDSRMLFGYTVGAGVDVALSDNWWAGVEYRYTNLGRAGSQGEFIDSNFRFPGLNEFSAVRVRLIYRFGR